MEGTAPVLVVDDDPKTVRLVRTYLEREGFSVITAAETIGGRDGTGARAVADRARCHAPGARQRRGHAHPPARLGRAGAHALGARVLANLLQNATRYTPEGGRVTVIADVRPRDALVSVTNTGDGIPPADLPHVFERFFRVERSRDRARGGAGIGLAIVKQLIELNGGQVGVGSSDGATRFWFSLPAPGR